MESMYEILMGLPLFKGVSYKKISEIIERTKFHFLKYLPGENIIAEGDECSHIKFIISGSVRSTISNADERFSVAQTLHGPDVIAPEYLFGRATRYPCSVTALEPTGILQLEKQEWVTILKTDQVFLFNYLNMLAMNAQRAVDGILAITGGSLEERIALWIVTLTQPGGTDIVLSCRQRNLYAFFGVQRSSFIASLDSMKERGLIDYTGSEIRVASHADMAEMLHSS